MSKESDQMKSHSLIKTPDRDIRGHVFRDKLLKIIKEINTVTVTLIILVK